MPVIKSAKKKLRQDNKKQEENKKLKSLLKELIKRAVKTKDTKKIQNAVRVADRAAKKHIIHKNKAARIKSQLYKIAPAVVKKKSPKKAHPEFTERTS